MLMQLWPGLRAHSSKAPQAGAQSKHGANSLKTGAPYSPSSQEDRGGVSTELKVVYVVIICLLIFKYKIKIFEV